MREVRHPRIELVGERHNHRQPLQTPIELVHHVQVLYLLQGLTAATDEREEEEACGQRIVHKHTTKSYPGAVSTVETFHKVQQCNWGMPCTAQGTSPTKRDDSEHRSR